MIVAVAPFISGDLEHRFDSMQDACALLVSETLAPTPGLRLVELAEARAIAEEIRLNAGGAIGRELLPYYLNGGYRNEGKDIARKVTLTLELKRGEQSLGKNQKGPMAADAVAASLRAMAGEALQPIMITPPAPADSAAECAELARLARQFQLIGEWEKALGLTEAALLLTPGDPALNKLGLDLSTRIINGAAADFDSIRHAAAIDLRALDFYARYQQSIPSAADKDVRGLLLMDEDLSAFWHTGERTWFQAMSRPESQPLLSELGKAKREIVLSRIESSATYTGIYDKYSNIDPLWTYVPIPEPPAERYQAYLRLFKAWHRQTGGECINYGRLLTAIKASGDTAAYETFLSQIAEMGARAHGFLVQYARIWFAPEPGPQRQDRLRQLIKDVLSAKLDRSAERELFDLLEGGIKAIDETAVRTKAAEAAERSRRGLYAAICGHAARR